MLLKDVMDFKAGADSRFPRFFPASTALETGTKSRVIFVLFLLIPNWHEELLVMRVETKMLQSYSSLFPGRKEGVFLSETGPESSPPKISASSPTRC